MKNLFKKIVSVTIILSVLVCIFIPTFAASAVNENYPTVYIEGQGGALVKEAGNSSSERIYPLDIGTDYLMDTVDKLNPVFLKGLLTGDYDAYCDVIYDAAAAKFSPILTDKNGEASDGSGSWWSWTLDSLKKTARELDGNYGLKSFTFRYDWRLDPCYLSKTLDKYIQDVMTATGAEKVNLVSRCLGCNIAAAYLVDFGYTNIDKCIFYASAIEGIDLCNEAFNGQIDVDPDSLERFVYDEIDGYISDEQLMEFVKTTVSLLNKVYGLDLATDFVMTIYNRVKANLVPRLLRITYAEMPSYLSMTNTESYEKIKKTMFGGLEDEYAGLLAKADNYHYHVQANIESILKQANNAGVKMMIVAKYGYQFLPIIESSDKISDGWLEFTSASFGGTTAPSVNDVFSNEYINSAKANGTYKYISPDKQIDTSTALFPDYTWVIKRIEHRNFPNCVDKLLETFLAFDGQMTVNDNLEFPQYMIYDEANDRIFPMAEDNYDVTNWNTNGLFTLIIKFISQAIPLIIAQISKTA